MANEGRGGYKDPPKEHRFKPGRSGNPKGRPPAPRTTEEALAKLVGRKVPLAIDGQRKKVPIREALALKAVQGALNGDPKHALALVKLLKQWETEKDQALKLAASQVAQTPEEEEKYRRWISVLVDLEAIAKALVELGVYVVTAKDEIRLAPWVLDILMSRRPDLQNVPAFKDLKLYYLADQDESTRPMPALWR